MNKHYYRNVELGITDDNNIISICDGVIRNHEKDGTGELLKDSVTALMLTEISPDTLADMALESCDLIHVYLFNELLDTVEELYVVGVAYGDGANYSIVYEWDDSSTEEWRVVAEDRVSLFIIDKEGYYRTHWRERI